MSERLRPETANADPDHDPSKGADPSLAETPNPDLLDAAAAGYDPVADAEAATASASAENPSENPNMGSEGDVGPEGAEQSRAARLLRGAAGAAIEATRWVAPAAGDALQKRTGFDAYDFVGGEQPVLTEDQKFTSGVLQFAGQRIAEHAAERLAARQNA